MIYRSVPTFLFLISLTVSCVQASKDFESEVNEHSPLISTGSCSTDADPRGSWTTHPCLLMLADNFAQDPTQILSNAGFLKWYVNDELMQERYAENSSVDWKWRLDLEDCIGHWSARYMNNSPIDKDKRFILEYSTLRDFYLAEVVLEMDRDELGNGENLWNLWQVFFGE